MSPSPTPHPAVRPAEAPCDHDCSPPAQPDLQNQTLSPCVVKPDPFHGYEAVARMCARFVVHLFACTQTHLTDAGTNVDLPLFVAHLIHRTKSHASVTVIALIILQRLKSRRPSIKAASGHRVFMTALLIALKTVADDVYPNKEWQKVTRKMFTLQEINRMEREMLMHVDWDVVVDNTTLNTFQDRFIRDFGQYQPTYPLYPLSFVSHRRHRLVPSIAKTGLPLSIASNSGASTCDGRVQTDLEGDPQLRILSPSCSTGHRFPPCAYLSGRPIVVASRRLRRARSLDSDSAPSFTFVEDAGEVCSLRGGTFAVAVPSVF